MLSSRFVCASCRSYARFAVDGISNRAPAVSLARSKNTSVARNYSSSSQGLGGNVKFSASGSRRGFVAASPLSHPPAPSHDDNTVNNLSATSSSPPVGKDNGKEDGKSKEQRKPKRKGSKSPAAKLSLRRVAVEAQRSAFQTRNGEQLADDLPPHSKTVTAYTVAERFDLGKVVEIAKTNGYEPDPFNTRLYPQVVHIQVPVESLRRRMGLPASEPHPHAHAHTEEIGDVFVFPSGTVVAWSLPDTFTLYIAETMLLSASVNPHIKTFETEDLDFVEDPKRDNSTVKGDTIVLGTKESGDSAADPAATTTTTTTTTSTEKPGVDIVLTKIAFSSGLARSTKLAVLESLLQCYIDGTRHIPALLSSDTRLPFTRRFILRKTGEVLSVRAQLNLYSELTDSLPDLFWDSRYDLGLEGYYDQVGKALDVGIRIKLLNERMDYAQEIASVLRERLSETHGLRLEWIVILLIAVEVGFEVLRLYKEAKHEKQIVAKQGDEN